MIDPSMTDDDFGRNYLGCKSAKTARRVIERDRIPHFVVSGHWLIKQSDADAWREARLVTPAVPDLKSVLRTIATKALEQRRAS